VTVCPSGKVTLKASGNAEGRAMTDAEQVLTALDRDFEISF
jgi:hypothetical protein